MRYQQKKDTSMNKQSFMGFLLIALVIILLPKYYEWVNPQPELSPTDSTGIVESIPKPEQTVIETQQPTKPSSQKIVNNIPDREITIETDLYKTIISNQAGGTFESFKLKQHFQIDGNDTALVELINKDQQESPFLSFINVNKGQRENLFNNFEVLNFDKQSAVINGKDSLTLRFKYVYDGKDIFRNFTFYADKYYINLENNLVKVSNDIASENFELKWLGGISYSEDDLDDENRYSNAYASIPEDVEKLKLKNTEPVGTQFAGTTEWTAIRSKYFAVAMVPSQSAAGYELTGTGKLKQAGEEEKLHKYFGMSLSLPKYKSMDTKIYLGPLKQSLLKEVDPDLDNIMSFGAAFIRPISKAVLWLFTNMYKVIPNYGFVLILFSILVKVLLHPLTVKSTQSMKAMSKLQPKINELKEKHDGYQQKIQQETMKLYGEHGVNPMGGCLPLLLQMPILFALFTVFRTTIQLRHAPFILWITDLSAPDALFTLPFSIPFYGQYVNLLPMVMVVSQILMQKMSGQSQSPQQKQMALIMPIMFFFIFNNFPSGLNLYYTLFNILTIVQQRYFTPEPKLKKKKGKQKKSRLERMRELQQKRKNFK